MIFLILSLTKDEENHAERRSRQELQDKACVERAARIPPSPRLSPYPLIP